MKKIFFFLLLLPVVGYCQSTTTITSTELFCYQNDSLTTVQVGQNVFVINIKAGIGTLIWTQENLVTQTIAIVKLTTGYDKGNSYTEYTMESGMNNPMGIKTLLVYPNAVYMYFENPAKRITFIGLSKTRKDN